MVKNFGGDGWGTLLSVLAVFCALGGTAIASAPQATEITGRAVFADGAPAAGLTVHPQWGSLPWPAHSVEQPIATDEHGDFRFEVGGVPQNLLWRLVFSGEGRTFAGPAYRWGTSPTQDLRISAPHTFARVTGSVRDRAGKPVGAGYIYLLRAGDGPAWLIDKPFRVDASGGFELGALGAGAYEAIYSIRRFVEPEIRFQMVSQTERNGKQFEISEENASNPMAIELNVEAPHWIDLVVVDKAGKAVADCRGKAATLEGRTPAIFPVEAIDPAIGLYRIPGCPAQRVIVAIESASGFGRLQEIEEGAGGANREPLKIVLEALGGGLVATIENGDGTPAIEVDVALHSDFSRDESLRRLVIERSLKTNPEGRIAAESLLPGKIHIIVPGDRSHLLLAAQGEIDGVKPTSLTLRREPIEFLKVSGTIRDAAGKPIAEANLRVTLARFQDQAHANLPRFFEGTSDAEGVWTVEIPVQLGREAGGSTLFDVYARHPEWGDLQEFLRTFDGLADRPLIMRPRLGMKGNLTYSTGTLSWEGAPPLPLINLVAFSQKASSSTMNGENHQLGYVDQVAAGVDGKFDLPNLPRGKWVQLYAAAYGRESPYKQTVEWREGNRSLGAGPVLVPLEGNLEINATVKLEPLDLRRMQAESARPEYPVHVRVVDHKTGEPVKGVAVRRTNGSWTFHDPVTDSDGRIMLTEVDYGKTVKFEGREFSLDFLASMNLPDILVSASEGVLHESSNCRYVALDRAKVAAGEYTAENPLELRVLKALVSNSFPVILKDGMGNNIPHGVTLHDGLLEWKSLPPHFTIDLVPYGEPVMRLRATGPDGSALRIRIGDQNGNRLKIGANARDDGTAEYVEFDYREKSNGQVPVLEFPDYLYLPEE